jgi:hypothetical protein
MLDTSTATTAVTRLLADHWPELELWTCGRDGVAWHDGPARSTVTEVVRANLGAGHAALVRVLRRRTVQLATVRKVLADADTSYLQLRTIRPEFPAAVVNMLVGTDLSPTGLVPDSIELEIAYALVSADLPGGMNDHAWALGAMVAVRKFGVERLRSAAATLVAR